MMNNGHFGDGDVAVLASVVFWLRTGGAGTVGCWWSGLPGVPVSALRKDLVRERPPGTYSAAPSYMALA